MSDEQPSDLSLSRPGLLLALAAVASVGLWLWPRFEVRRSQQPSGADLPVQSQGSEEALALLRAGRTEEAIARFEALRRRHPSSIAVLNNLAVAYQRQGRLEDAHRTLEEAIEIDDREAVTWVNLALLSLRSNEPVLALAYADRAIEYEPALSRGHLARGQSLLRLERLDEAAESLETVVRTDPTAARALLTLAATYARLGRPEDAIEHYTRAIELRPRLLTAHLGLARVHLERGELELATNALGAARQISPRNPNLLRLEAELASRRASGE